MHMRYDGQLTTMIKAMTDVVIPAVDDQNQLAMEQAQLVVGMLKLMARQLPVQFRFDRDELKRLIETANVIAPLDDPGGADDLKDSTEQARTLLRQCTVDPRDLYQSVLNMRQVICDAIDRVNQPGCDPDIAQRVESIILAMSQQQQLRDRALLLPQGWELDPAALPPIETLIASNEA